MKVDTIGMAARLKQLREDAGLTQAEIGKITGVSNKAVWRWEQGASLPKMGSVQKLADFYRVPISWLIEGESDTLNALVKQLEENDDPVSTLIGMIADFSEEEIKDLTRYAEFIKTRR